jgi:hypothetical protein
MNHLTQDMKRLTRQIRDARIERAELSRERAHQRRVRAHAVASWLQQSSTARRRDGDQQRHQRQTFVAELARWWHGA